ncbi:hypothetical protein ANCDUO_01020 [Ancylostoma duodenale]|uniref:Histone H2A n=1 Tax=Ancylostoma duodenale TaxID=51022 RepID=A0A0C2HAH6_9BILA|nr:hypothetical protein ANCDUO_01020 [Ancylostoma duodenale]
MLADESASVFGSTTAQAAQTTSRNDRVSVKVSVYFAAVLEYLVAEVVEVAGNAAKDMSKHRIEP